MCKTTVITLILLSVLPSRAGMAGTPIIWDENGHAYEIVADGGSWDSALSAAAMMEFRGVNGYLAAITSADENAFIVSVIEAFEAEQGPHNLLWLGGLQEDPDVPPAEGWSWITRESWDYTNWNAGEPNDAAGGEQYLAMYGSGNPNAVLGSWNDDRLGEGNTGFVVEYAVPAPSGMLMFVVAASARRRRRRC